VTWDGEHELIDADPQWWRNPQLRGAVEARRIAIKAHEGQRYHDGTYFDLHLRRVVRRLEPLAPQLGWDVVAAGYLHDVVEDTAVGFPDLRRNQYLTTRCVDAVEHLTHWPWIPYPDYVTQLCLSGDALALEVKRADIESNVSMSHLGDGRYLEMADRKWLPALAQVLRTLQGLGR
jgi:hypothetical protein